MARVGVVLGLLLVVAVIAVGVWQRADPQGATECVDGWWEQEGVRELLIDGKQQEPEPFIYKTNVFLTATNCTVDGNEIPMAWAKTQLADQKLTAQGKVRIFGVENMPTGPLGPGVLGFLTLSAGSGAIMLFPNYAYDSGGVTQYVYNGTLTDGFTDYIFNITVPGDGAWHEYDWYIGHSMGVYRSASTNPIGAEKDGQTHSKECLAEDRWQDLPASTVYVGFDQYETSYVLSEMPEPSTISMSVEVTLSFDAMYPDPDIGVLEITVDYNGAEPDFSGLGDIAMPNITPLAGYTSNPPRVEGSGNTLHFYVDDWPGGCYAGWGGLISPPHVYTFSGITAVDMDGVGITDLLVTCPAVQVYDSSTSTWVPVTQTTSAWNSYTAKPTWGCYSWDVDPPPNGAVRTLAGVSFYITEASGKDKLLDGFADGTVSTPSFEHDATMIIDGWWIDSADCTSTPYKVLATITHNDYAELYGPQDAVSHDDWVSTGDIGAVDVDGNFTVPASGEGTMYLDLPSNFETRLAAVTAQNFPEGMSIVPGIYWYHRADMYAAFDGEPGNQSGTWSEPAEACYCGWGWPCLRLEFPTCPADALLAVTLTGKTFTHTDNHYTGSVRQEEYDYTPSPFTHTYSCQLVSGVGYVYLSVSDTSTDPDLEVVERITVSGFGDGSWQMAEPRWCEDPTAGVEHQRVKFFENWRYNDGGFSATSGSCVRTALQDGTETNSGKDNPVETRTVRIFDVVESENYMIDLTAAKSLAIMCGDVQSVCDAWTCTHNTAAAEAATTDADDNVLKTVSTTDLKPVVGHTATGLDAAVRVYQWTTAPGIEYDFTARKIVGGSMQGVLVDEALRTLMRDEVGAIVWVRPGVGGEYAIHDEPTTNAAGVWRAVSGDIYASFSPDVLNDYGVSFVGEDNEIHSTGRWAAREYDFALIVPVVIVRHDVWMAPPGLIYQLRSEGKELKIYWLPYPHSAEWEGGTLAATASEDPEDLCVRGLATQPYLHLAWREGTALKLAHTHDVGDYCVGPYTEALGYSVMRHELVGRRWFTAGLKDGAWYIRYRDAGVLPPAWLPFATGATEAKIVDSEAQEMFVCGDTQTALYAVFDGVVYRSVDGGATWTNAGTYTATGWSRLCGTVIGNRLLVFGFVDGAWSCKQLILGQTVTEVVGADGALAHPLTGVGEGYLSPEMTSDADPLVVCNEATGMGTYYSKDFGENWAEIT